MSRRRRGIVTRCGDAVRRVFGNASAWDTSVAGKRIELHPGMDLWMRGARYGTLIAVHRTGKAKIQLDKLKRPIVVAQGRWNRID